MKSIKGKTQETHFKGLSRVKINKVVIDLLEKHNIFELSADKIALKLGIRKPSLFNYYPTVENLLFSAIQQAAILAEKPLGFFENIKGQLFLTKKYAKLAIYLDEICLQKGEK